MKRVAFIMFSSLTVLSASSQSIADGVKAVYYEKYKTAKDIFQKLITANPADAEANYWLGQVDLDQDDIAAARAVYAKAITATNQNPLIVVGMGHVELLEGKAADAKAHFDAALAATNNKKGGDVKILTAVGRANADGDSKTGDPAFGIEKLAAAAKLDVKDPEILVLSGISQLKRGGEYGGPAKQAYEEALNRDPKYARAKLRIAKIFQSQGNPSIFIPLMEEATQLDPAYGPAWLALSQYYAKRDVNKAKEYIEKFVGVAEKDCNTDFYYADYLLQAGDKEGALAKAKQMETSGCSAETYPPIYKLYALAYDRLGDSVAAKANVEKYIAKQIPGKLVGDDYALQAAILTKFPGEEANVEAAVNKAVDMDTSVENKLAILRNIAATFGARNNFAGQYKALNRMMELRSDTTARNYYFLIDAAMKANEFAAASKFSQMYIASYPEQAQGYYYHAKAEIALDADTSKGTAVPAVQQYIDYLQKDTVKNKRSIVSQYYYLIPYFANHGEWQKALDAINAVLVLDPANAYALGAKPTAEKQVKGGNGVPDKKEPAAKQGNAAGAKPSPGK